MSSFLYNRTNNKILEFDCLSDFELRELNSTIEWVRQRRIDRVNRACLGRHAKVPAKFTELLLKNSGYYGLSLFNYLICLIYYYYRAEGVRYNGS